MIALACFNLPGLLQDFCVDNIVCAYSVIGFGCMYPYRMLRPNPAHGDIQLTMWKKMDVAMKSAMFAPCAFLEVMAKADLRGNCLRFMWKGKTFSICMRGIPGMNILFPACGLHAMASLMTCWCRCWMMYLVPFQWPFVRSRLCRSMTILFFSRSLFEVAYRRELIKSMGYWFDRIAAMVFFFFSREKTHN